MLPFTGLTRMKASRYSTEQCAIDSMDICVATIDAMLLQEDRYSAGNHRGLHPLGCENGLPVDADARSKITTWCSSLMKINRYPKDTAAIAIDYLDRYVATHQGKESLHNPRLYQLVALSCVYCAIKVHGHRPLAPAVVAKLSNGERSREDVEKMELKLLHALQWRMNPPMAMSFVRSHLDCIPHGDEIDAATRQALLDLCQIQIDASLSRYEFIFERRSRLGLAALLNAANSLCEDGPIFLELEHVIHQRTNMTRDDLASLRYQLYECISSVDVSSSSLPMLRKPSLRVLSTAPDVMFSNSPRQVISNIPLT